MTPARPPACLLHIHASANLIRAFMILPSFLPGTKIVDLPPLELLYYASGSANMRMTNTGHSLRLDSGNCKNVVFPEIYGGRPF